MNILIHLLTFTFIENIRSFKIISLYTKSFTYQFNTMKMNNNNKIPMISVVAVTPSWGIGNKGTLPWNCIDKHLPKDLAYFKKITSITIDPMKVNAVIMGKTTWQSIPLKYQPLPGRINFVISKSLSLMHENPSEYNIKNVYYMNSLDHVIDFIQNDKKLFHMIEKLVIIGGVQLFEESLFHNYFETLHLTQVEEEFDCDTYLSNKTIEYLSKQDLKSYITEDNIIENDIKYRIIEFPVNHNVSD